MTNSRTFKNKITSIESILQNWQINRQFLKFEWSDDLSIYETNAYRLLCNIVL